MRKPVIAGNWKMHKLVSEAVATATDLKPRVANSNHCQIIIAPPFTALRAVADRLEGSRIQVAAQDLAAESKQGAHTGAVCGDMIRDCGASHVIIGHSERRALDGETDALVNRKIRAALAFDLVAIVCVGETLEQYEKGESRDIVVGQIDAGLSELTPDHLSRIILAYEPIWAIGTGRTATPEIAQQIHAAIRERIARRFYAEAAADLRILYGGSVKPDNISALMKQPDVDGALVGGASLDADGFARIVNYER
jgi:triosephosphate isomerase (TIM)